MTRKIKPVRAGAFLQSFLGLAAALSILGVVELGLRTAYGPPARRPLPENFEYAHMEVLKPYFKRRWGLGGAATMVPQRRESQAPPFAASKPAGTLRIFIVGGSVALPFSNITGTKLESFVRSALPGRQVEIVTCGMAAYDSRREAAVMREILDYQPDLVILLSGNNEYHGPEIRFPRLVLLDHRLGAMWSYHGLKALVSLGLKPRKPAEVNPEQSNPLFEKNLREMARMCRARGIPLVLSTLGANLRDSPPSSQRPKLDEPLYFDAIRAWEEGKYRFAGERLQRFVERFPEDPYGRFYLAKAQDRLGDRRGARKNYALASDLDLPGNRTSPARNEIIRRVAREEGTILADLEKVFKALASNETPGAESFRDTCHWMQELYPLVSLTVLRAVHEHARARRVSALAPAADWSWGWAEGLEPALGRPTITPKSRDNYFNDALHSALALAVVVDGERLSEGSIDLMQRTMNQDAAKFERMTRSKADLDPLFEKQWFQDYRQGISEHWPVVLVHLGEAWRRERRPDLALAKFSEALALQPDYYQARLRRAVATADRAELESLADQFPGRAEARLWAEHFRERR